MTVYIPLSELIGIGVKQLRLALAYGDSACVALDHCRSCVTRTRHYEHGNFDLVARRARVL